MKFYLHADIYFCTRKVYDVYLRLPRNRLSIEDFFFLFSRDKTSSCTWKIKCAVPRGEEFGEQLVKNDYLVFYKARELVILFPCCNFFSSTCSCLFFSLLAFLPSFSTFI